jgi:hypothetical protein
VSGTFGPYSPELEQEQDKREQTQRDRSQRHHVVSVELQHSQAQAASRLATLYASITIAPQIRKGARADEPAKPGGARKPERHPMTPDTKERTGDGTQQRDEADLDDALDLLGIAMPVRTYPGCGGLWFGHNAGIADATFTDWGLARAVAVILNHAHREAQARRAA